MLDTFNNGMYRDNDVGITLCSNRAMRSLTMQYTGDRHVTDVLTIRLSDILGSPNDEDPSQDAFPWHVMFANLAAASNSKDLLLTNKANGNSKDYRIQLKELGNIVIAPDYCTRVANKRGIELPYYMTMVTAHGLAHLVGHDHDTDANYAKMKQAEKFALGMIRDSLKEERGIMPTSYLP